MQSLGPLSKSTSTGVNTFIAVQSHVIGASCWDKKPPSCLSMTPYSDTKHCVPLILQGPDWSWINYETKEFILFPYVSRWDIPITLLIYEPDTDSVSIMWYFVNNNQKGIKCYWVIVDIRFLSWNYSLHSLVIPDSEGVTRDIRSVLTTV